MALATPGLLTNTGDWMCNTCELALGANVTKFGVIVNVPPRCPQPDECHDHCLRMLGLLGGLSEPLQPAGTT